MKKLARKLPVLPEGFGDPRLPQKTFSHSQYSSFKKCGRAYAYSYVEGIKIPPTGALFKGSVIHKGAESALTSVMEDKKLPSLDEAQSFVAGVFEDEQETVEKWEADEPVGIAKDLTIRAYSTYHAQALPKIHPLQVEDGFAIKFGGAPVIGYIDLVDQVREFNDAGDAGRKVLADLKTGAATWSQDDADREPQFTLYAHATGISNVRVDNIVFLKKGPEFRQRDTVRTKEQVAVLEEDYADVVNMIHKGIFPMAPIDSWQCTEKWCGYWSRCRGRKR